MGCSVSALLWWLCCQGTAPYWGHYLCNAPPQTTEHMIEFVASLEPHFVIYTGLNLFIKLQALYLISVLALASLVIVLYAWPWPWPAGDNPPHTIWEQSLEGQLASSRWVAQTMLSKLAPGTEAYPSLGNHGMYLQSHGTPVSTMICTLSPDAEA